MVPSLRRTAVILSFSLLLGFQVQADPLIRWVRRLKGCGSISDAGPRRGNGVVSAVNDQTVWITDDEGALHILDADNHTKDEIYFKPPLVANRWTESRSSVSLFVEPNGTATEYAVYAVIDVDPNAPSATTSRVIAVHGDGELLGSIKWQVEIEGIAVQTPQIGTNGTRIYATHNDASGRGYFSIINGEGNRITRQSNPKPFGPLTILSVDGNDEVFWGESSGRGYSKSGRIFHHDSSLEITRVGHEIITSTVVPLVLWREKKRRRMWLGGTSSTMHGWVDGQSFADAPSWSRQISPSLRNNSYPIATSIAFSPDGLRLYVASASTTFYCFNAKNGNIIWESETYDSVFLNGAVLSPDYSSVYTIQHRDGTVEKRSATTGDLFWSFNCTSIPGRHSACQDSVEAEFSLSSNGNTMYYADIFGNVVSISMNPSLQLQNASAASEGPSSEPIHSPESSAEPSSSISAKPSPSPSSGERSVSFSTVPSALPSYVPSNVTSPYQSALTSPLPTDKMSPWPTNGPMAKTNPPSPSSPADISGDEVDSRAPPRIPATNGTLGYRTETNTASNAEHLQQSLSQLNALAFMTGFTFWLIIFNL